jgi:hypothetical protein
MPRVLDVNGYTKQSAGLTSGQITQFFLASGSVTSGNIASGQVGHFAIASGAIVSGAISSGAIVSFVGTDVRMSLSSGVPITATDTSGSNIYVMPYGGNAIWIAGANYNFTQMVLPCQQTAVSGLLRSGTTIISGLVSTSGLAVRMQVSGTGIPANTIIITLNTNSSLTLSNAVTTSGSEQLSFSLPASTLTASSQQSGSVWDVWAFYMSGNTAVQFGTRFSGGGRMDPLTLANGLWANQNVINSGNWNSIGSGQGTYLGTILVGNQPGYVVDAQRGGTTSGGWLSGGVRGIWNNYNRVARSAQIVEVGSQWFVGSFASGTNNWAMVDWEFSSGTQANRVDIVIGLQTEMIQGTTNNYWLANTGSNTFAATIGDNSLLSGICQIGAGFPSLASGQTVGAAGSFQGYLSIGYHGLSWLEQTSASGNLGLTIAAFNSLSGGNVPVGLAGMEVIVWQ